MFTLIHVVLAIAGLAVSGLSVLSPTRGKIRLSYILTALVIVSGTYLVVSTHAPMLKTCLAGLAYLAVNLGLISFAQSRLAKDS